MLVIVGLFALLSLATPAEAIAPPRLQLQVSGGDVEFMDYCLDSGLRVVFQVDRSQPLVSVSTVVGSGGAADPEGMAGMAHLVEHLWFRSSQAHVPAVWQLRNRLGASMNGFTSFDTTTYTTVAPAQYVRTLLEIEGQRLVNPLNGVTPEIFETEREVVRNELRQNYEDTSASGRSSAYQRMFPEGHPYHRLVIGDHETLDAIDLEAAQAWAVEQYRPANTTIMVVGDIDPEATNVWLAQTFPAAALEGPGGSCAARIPAEAPAVPDPTDTSFVREQAEVDELQALITWAVPGGYRPVEGLERMVMSMLSSSLRRYQGRSVPCSIYVQTEASVISCRISLHDPDDRRAIQDPEQRLRRALDGVHEMWDMTNRDWQARSYSRSRLGQAADLFLAGEEVSGTRSTRSTLMTRHLHHTGNVDYFMSRLGWLEPIRAGHAAEFAARYLDKRRAVVTILSPITERSATRVGDHHGGGAQQLDDQVFDDLAAEVERLFVPLDLEPMVDIELDNGLRVLMLPYGTMPYARVGLLLPGGASQNPSARLDDTTWDNVQSLWKDEQGHSMGRAPNAIGGEWRIENGPGWHEYSISGSGANLEAQLYLLRARMDSVRVKQDDKADDLEAMENSLWRAREQPEHWEAVAAWPMLAPEHAEVLPLDEAGLLAIKETKLGVLKAWNRSIVDPERATLVVVGRYDQERAQDWVERWWADWSPRGDAQPLPSPNPLPDAPERTVLVLDRPTTTQTQVTLRCQLPGLDAEQALAQDMAAYMFTSRTKYELRVKSGWTYGVHRSFVDLPGIGRLLTVNTSVQNSAAGQTLATMLGLMDEVGFDGVARQVLARQQVAWAQSYAQGQQSTRQVLDRILYPLERGMELDYVTDYEQRLAALQPQDLVGALEGCREHEVITMVGPAEEIAPQLDELGIAFEHYNWRVERDRLMQEHDPKRWEKAQKER